MIKNEHELMQYLREKHSQVFPFFKKVEFETPIIGYWSNKRIGLCDITFKYGSWYACEVKYAIDEKICSNSFWDSLKAIGYAEALSLIYKQKFRPIIMIPKKIITNDFLTIIGKLDIDYILAYPNDGQEMQFDIFTKKGANYEM